MEQIDIHEAITEPLPRMGFMKGQISVSDEILAQYPGSVVFVG